MGNSLHILIVEDEPNVRLVFRTTLETSGYTVSIAEDGENALGLLKEMPFDLVLLDLQLPGIGGLQVLERLRELAGAIPVVIVTAYASPPNAVLAVKLGAVEFLGKPLSPRTLRTAVAAVLAGPRDRDQHAAACLDSRADQPWIPDHNETVGDCETLALGREPHAG